MKLTPGAVPLLISVCFFALMNVGVKHICQVPVLEIVLVRSLVTLIFGYVILRWKRIHPWGRHKALLLLRGSAGTVALTAYFHTLQHMPLATAVTVQYLSPLFTILIAAVILREPPRPIQVPFFLLAFLGVALVKGFDPEVSLGELLVGVGSAVASAVAYNTIRALRDKEHALVVVFYFPLVTVPTVGPCALARWIWPTTQEWSILLAVGLSTTVAQVFLTRAYQVDRPANISTLNYVGIVFALLLGQSFFGEVPGLAALAGVLLIAIGVGLSTRYARDPA